MYDECYFKLIFYENKISVVELQSFDEYDYDQRKFITDKIETEAEAEALKDKLLIEVYNRGINFDHQIYDLNLALVKQIYRQLMDPVSSSDLCNLLDNTVSKIEGVAELAPYEVQKIRQIISGLIMRLISE